MKTLMRWMIGIGILAGCLTGCDRRARIMPGAYVASGTPVSAKPRSLFIDRDNATVWLHLPDGTVVMTTYSERAPAAWPPGCPANLGSTQMEVLDLALEDFRVASTTMQHPILVRNCPPDPVEVVLREAGEIGGAGTACASAATCLTFSWTSELDALPDSMKGYELYSWRDNPSGPWTYTLITGTNRNKTWEEISSPESTVTAEGWVQITVSGEARLRSVLGHLPEGSEIFWIGPGAARSDTDLSDRIGIPKTKTVRALITYGRDHGDLRIHVSAGPITNAGSHAPAAADEVAAVRTEPDKSIRMDPPTPSPTPQLNVLAGPLPPTRPTPLNLTIHLFTAEAVTTDAGDSISLTWETAGGRQVTICPLIGDRVVGCRCLWDLPPAGTQAIAPEDVIARYSGFVLQVDGPLGCPAEDCITQRTGLSVSCPPGTPAWFFQPAPQICPEAPAVTSKAAEQLFEHGTMIWIAAQDSYTVLYDSFLPASGTEAISASLTSAQILQGPLDLLPGADPDNRLGESPPEGMMQPQSGFGLVWRAEVAGSEPMRARLGWALGPERGFTTVIQCEKPCGTHQACYLRDAADNVLRTSYLMHVGHIWDVVAAGGATP